MRAVLTEKGMPSVVVDMTETTGVASPGMGILAQIAFHSISMLQAKPTRLFSGNDILKIFKGMDFESAFNILRGAETPGADFQEIQPSAAEEKEMTCHILATHRTLMNMGPENKGKFGQAIKVFENKHAAASRFESRRS